MHDFFIKKLSGSDIETELLNIGFDKSYAFKAKNKFKYLNLKIFNITPTQGNIIKQLALSVGADCGTHKEVITGRIEKSDCIIGGNLNQLSIIAKKLELQPFGLKELGKLLEEQIQIQNSEKTKLVGILNLTKDSLSDGGDFYEYENAIKHLDKLISDGADIIDLGAESTKPGAKAISPDEQLKHLIPVLKYINQKDIKKTISIDTRSSEVANNCIKFGVNIINDVSGFDYDENMPTVLAKYPNVKVVIQHSQGTPDIMQNNPQYGNLMDEIFIKLKQKTDLALSKGILKENIIIDPGIGFGKTREQNFEILKRWKEFQTLGFPIMIGVSRKSLLNMQSELNEEKDIYTLALNSILINENVDYIRIHNVEMHRKFINMYYGTGS